MLLFFVSVIGLLSDTTYASKRLKFVAVITRHGARAPTAPLEFDKALWEGYNWGELTPGGMR